MYRLDEKSRIPLYIQLYEQIRSDIEQGRTTAGSMLMSGRRLAEMLGVSRNTVDQAYEKLLSEGYIISSPRRGYYVEKNTAVEKAAEKKPEEVLYDLTTGTKCLEGFPMGKWRLCANRALTDAEVFLKSPEPFGDRGLREELRSFLYRHRGISCTANEIFVFGSEEICLAAALALTGAAGVFAVNPSWAEKKLMNFTALGQEKTASPEICLYISPFMNCADAEVLVKDAQADGAWVVENGRGFLYDENGRVLAQQNGRVIYTGSFSDIIFPGLETAYMVLPPAAAEKMRTEGFSASSGAVQRAIMLFMRDRNWERYLHRLAKSECEKAAEFAAELKRHTGSAPVLSGRCIYIEETSERTDEIINRAKASGILADRCAGGIRLSCSAVRKADVTAAAAAFAAVLRS